MVPPDQLFGDLQKFKAIAFSYKAQQRCRPAGNMGQHLIQKADLPVIRKRIECAPQRAIGVQTGHHPKCAGHAVVMPDAEHGGRRHALYGGAIAQGPDENILRRRLPRGGNGDRRHRGRSVSCPHISLQHINIPGRKSGRYAAAGDPIRPCQYDLYLLFQPHP